MITTIKSLYRHALFSRVSKLIFLGLCYSPFLAYSGQMDNLRNTRYCEILLPQKRLDFAVYNTIGLNDCPAQIWDKITVASIKKETSSYWAHLNGPRYWTIDGFKNSKLVNPQTRILGGLAMREAGILHLELFEFFKGVGPYHTKTVDRNTTWLFKAGKPVYELVNDKGQVFVMQSYSIQKVMQTEASLPQLGTKLALPVGWHFRTGVLSKDTELKAIDNKATVVQDNYLNTYQLATHDFLW